ncbi:hypothetical protein E3Z27_07520 [Pseudomonas mediterranea]|jgi:hypothetical protein|uniref:Barstar (barnase inhibitor) domain-containing protein n=1 Tax=Pseudomonas mediterranea TaxID=183795 RepID=A0AAX2DHT6_9PSED|nr:hypothetical protein [Pseudomonas mediterranea]KGU84461.1 hypothetical protein N005_13895 [Pseudomonas mediterranea CFBP 5447]MBL0843559.1 hypothetical protein [Pseudomonas mediterranea]MDU9029416.1 hypothetical protein [Pseudomonas mediterranea]QHA81544.1 hypothetical protein E3Z27_07520 [Pseudomonas mediterranea]SDU72696.1 hypothetical protein SAMN05216476_4838 [Pseudomonas mediterranea]
MKIIKNTDSVSSTKYEHWKSQWEDQSELDEFSYISDVVHPEDALMFCKVLFPDFIFYESGVFLESRFTIEAFSSWMEACNNDVVEVEKVLNHMHLYDVFGGCSDKVDDAVYEQLCRIVAQSWRMVLLNKFPEKNFCVQAIVSDQEYGPVVTFSQVRE